MDHLILFPNRHRTTNFDDVIYVNYESNNLLQQVSAKIIQTYETFENKAAAGNNKTDSQ